GARRHGRGRAARPRISPRDRCVCALARRDPASRARRGERIRGSGLRRRRRAFQRCRSASAGHPRPHRSRQRFALHEDGARRRGADRRAHRRSPLMLLELAQWLAKDLRVFNVFSYITLRAVLACLTALAVSLVLGPYMIRKLTAYKIGQAVRDDGPRSHLTKAGTPTMGGALILVSICVPTLVWGDR